MKKRAILALGLATALLLTACGSSKEGQESQPEARLTVVATTYPVYLLASAVAENVDGVVVERLNTGEVSCLHDYTLTVYALDCVLDLEEGYYLNEFRRAARGHVLATSTLELPSRA